MFLGHYGFALAAKRADPDLPLGRAFAAAQFLDLIWPVFVLAGIERVGVEPGATAVSPLAFTHYPWSHSLAMTLLWSAAFATTSWLVNRRGRQAVLLGLLVASHWVLDWITHRPDLPLAPGAAKVGLGLWQHVGATLVVEAGLFAAGVWAYLRAGGPKRRGVFFALIGFLVAMYLASVFGPPPPVNAPASMIAGPALAMWLFVAWAWWSERERKPT